jgi:hypothetical protein
MATRSKKPTSKPKKATRGKAPATEQPDDVLAGYDDEGRPQWELGPEERSLSGEPSDDDEVPFPSGDSDAWDDDVPVVTAEDLDEAERALAEKEVPAPMHMHSFVAALVERDRNIVPLDDYDPESPRTESLPVALTERELREKGDLLAKRIEAEENLKAENKRHRTALKQAEDALHAEVVTLSAVVRSGEEFRKVPVARVANLRSNVVHQVRLDTGAIVPGRDRSMTGAEIEAARQSRLPGVS